MAQGLRLGDAPINRLPRALRLFVRFAELVRLTRDTERQAHGRRAKVRRGRDGPEVYGAAPVRPARMSVTQRPMLINFST